MPVGKGRQEVVVLKAGYQKEAEMDGVQEGGWYLSIDLEKMKGGTKTMTIRWSSRGVMYLTISGALNTRILIRST